MDLSLLFPILILLLFIPIFLSGRKQKRQMAQTQAMQSALTEGDVVTTTSGLRGTVVDASYEDTIDLEIADGVVTTWLRAAVRDKVAQDDHAEHGDEPEETPGATAAPATGELPTGGATSTNGTPSANGTVADTPADSTADEKK
ncbi:preprotein translocase subunit YajC [Pseudonocardia kujensis]|uniref:preprotein translocase subunit YajC n=1 Tax=Pseudonocardia kujensis TaxID=1128675 RepID=UPI001E43A088|nr:preprotein translocase subunit YajC [Pseudonocardia kujensis]MCE0767505.1 preprotein translocase subunit YajC [Pseudonocardia kujensis]